MAASSGYQTVLSRLASTADSALPAVLDKLLPRLVNAAASASEADLPQLFTVINYIKKRLTADPSLQVPFGGLAESVVGARGSSLQALGIFLRLGRERLQFPRDNAAVLKLAANLDFKEQSSPLVCELLIMVSTQHTPSSFPGVSPPAFRRHCQDCRFSTLRVRTTLA